MKMDNETAPTIVDEFNKVEHLLILSSLGNYQLLCPLNDQEVVLSWVFSNPEQDSIQRLLVRLTEEEAQTVYETWYEKGMIEGVRKTLATQDGVITVSSHHRIDICFPEGMVNPLENLTQDQQKIITIPFTIPREGTEEEFIDILISESRNALEQLPGSVDSTMGSISMSHIQVDKGTDGFN